MNKLTKEQLTTAKEVYNYLNLNHNMIYASDVKLLIDALIINQQLKKR